MTSLTSDYVLMVLILALCGSRIEADWNTKQPPSSQLGKIKLPLFYAFEEKKVNSMVATCQLNKWGHSLNEFSLKGSSCCQIFLYSKVWFRKYCITAWKVFDATIVVCARVFPPFVWEKTLKLFCTFGHGFLFWKKQKRNFPWRPSSGSVNDFVWIGH